jgi:hypothetical protein
VIIDLELNILCFSKLLDPADMQHEVHITIAASPSVTAVSIFSLGPSEDVQARRVIQHLSQLGDSADACPRLHPQAASWLVFVWFGMFKDQRQMEQRLEDGTTKRLFW